MKGGGRMEEILEYNYEDEMKESFRDYAVSVIVSRSLPDVRDGFKPVHRRILYAMKDLGILPNTPHKKSARIVGEVIGKYHPHGDTAVYETMVRLSQDFRMMVPLVDGHGNFGSIDGDGAAAMRYTEARLSDASVKLLDDLEKNVVDYKDNYDGTEREPELLPTKFPQLLINGYLGIAVGMRGSVPPHNVNEVIDAFIGYTKKKNATAEDMLAYLSAPDYPTGGILINPEEVKDFYRTGEGKAVIRSKIEIEDAPYGKKNIVITEIPYTVSGGKTKLVNDITMKVVDKELTELSDVRDESSKDGIRVVLEVKKGINIDKLLQKLYSKTKIQDDDSYQFIALVDGVPKTLSITDYFKEYLAFQKEINLRKYAYLLERGLKRKEILDGLVKAVDQIDVIVDTIRGSNTVKQMQDCLTTGETKGISFKLKKNETSARKFAFTESQAKAILEMKLQRLGALEVDKLEKDKEKLEAELKKYEEILNNPKVLLQLIRKEHMDFKKGFGAPRKTEVREMENKKFVEQKKVEKVTVLVDKYGYAKTIDQTTSKDSIKNLKKDYSYVLPTNSDDRLLVFTNNGNLHQLKMKDIPHGKLKDKGTTVQALSGFELGEHIVHIATKEEAPKKTFLFVNSSGLAKQVEGKELMSNRSKVLSTKLDKEDRVVFVQEVTSGKEKVILQTKQGYVLKVKIDVFSMMGKNAKGMVSINLKKDDIVDQVFLVGEASQPLMVNGTKVDAKDIPIGKRGTVGKRY